MSKKIPDIRFKGFNDEWISNKLGDMIHISSASRVHKEEWRSEGVPFFRSSDVISKYNRNYNAPAFISEALYQELSKKSGKMKAGDLLVTGGGTIGVPYLKENEEPLYFKDADLIWLKNSGIIDGRFLYNFFITPQTRRYISSITHIGTISHYTIEQGKNTPIILPNTEEQQKIGTFFKQLEDTITLQDQLVEQQQQYKKAMLIKMFPQKGERVPRVRFDGFSGEWKKTKIKNVLNEYIEKSTVEDEYDLLSSTNNGIEERNGRVSGISNIGYKIIRKGNVVLSPQNLWLGNINYNSKYEIGIVSPSYKTFIIIDSSKDFIARYLRLPMMFKKYEQSSLQGASVVRRNLDIDLFNQITILLPSLEEQQKIGTFFKQLDDTITLHEKKLGYYQQLKKALLKRMFV